MMDNTKGQIAVFLTGFIGFLVMCAIVFLAIILSGCSSNPRRARAKKIDELPREVVMLRYNNDRQREIILAYENLIHRIWVDQPTYFEECLTEGDEFAVLDVLYDSEWKDIFTFRCEEDSLAYMHNWDNNQCTTHVIKHIVSPKPPFGGEEEEK